MYCNKCGRYLENDVKFCNYCGHQVTNSVQTTNSSVVTKDQMEMQIKMQQLAMQQQQMNIQAEQLRLQQQQFNSMVKCPRCGSTSISSNKKGYGVVKGGLGAVTAMALAPVTGGASLAVGAIGAGAGNIGRKKVICTCMNCGYKFKAGRK